MNDFLKSKLFRFMKFSLSSLVGTVVDTLVLWLFSHFVFTRYVGQYIISPVISFECAVFANYLLSYFMVWKERVTNVSRRSFLCRYVAYNASCTGVFLLKMFFLVLIQFLFKWNVVWCNLIALCFSGIANFFLNDLLIFKKKEQY